MSRRASVFGAAMDTGNLGVSALGAACALGLHREGWEVTLFDNSRGTGGGVVVRSGAEDVRYTRRGAWHSRRLYRAESLHLMWAMSAGRVGFLHPGLRELRRSEAVFDISGGDSFTDLYGVKRYETVTMPKRIALSERRPLILLPQTYGPFRDLEHRREARAIVCRSRQAWARDSSSFQRLRELLDEDFRPDQHRQGVDVAFSLPPVQPAISDHLSEWLGTGEPIAGVNVSGLLYRAEDNRRKFGLRADYAAATAEFVRWLLEDEGVRVLLIPHVVGRSPESDESACDDIRRRGSNHERLQQVPRGLNALETKWMISRCSWLTAARMHATIAALSTHVPVMATAYSAKVAGVFLDCGVGGEVADARALSTSELLDSWRQSWARRQQVRALLMAQVPSVVASSARQFTEIVAAAGTRPTDA